MGRHVGAQDLDPQVRLLLGPVERGRSGLGRRRVRLGSARWTGNGSHLARLFRLVLVLVPDLDPGPSRVRHPASLPVYGFFVWCSSSQKCAQQLGVEDAMGDDKDARRLVPALAPSLAHDGFDKGSDTATRSMACIRQPGCFLARDQRSPLQDLRLVGPISDVAQRLSVRKLERPPRMSVVTLATLGPRPRLSLGLAKVLFLKQRRESQGWFRICLLLSVNLLSGPRRSQEVRSKDGVDGVVFHGFPKCFRLLRDGRKRWTGSTGLLYDPDPARLQLTFIPVVSPRESIRRRQSRLPHMTTIIPH